MSRHEDMAFGPHLVRCQAIRIAANIAIPARKQLSSLGRVRPHHNFQSGHKLKASQVLAKEPRVLGMFFGILLFSLFSRKISQSDVPMVCSYDSVLSDFNNRC